MLLYIYIELYSWIDGESVTLQKLRPGNPLEAQVNPRSQAYRSILVREELLF